MNAWLQTQEWKRFKCNIPAVVSLWVFIGLLLVSAFANLVANDKPILMWYEGKLYLPALVDYLPKDFSKDGFVVDYFELEQEFRDKGWVIFPPIKQRPFEQNLNFDKLPAPPGTSSRLLVDKDSTGIETNHWLGTDTGGRDLFTRLLYGSRTSLLMAILITLLAASLGISIGGFIAYSGGRMDLYVSRLLETIGYFPVIFLIIILVAFLESPSPAIICVIFALIGMPQFAFYMRGQVLKIRKHTYIEAALALGQSDWKIMFSHILPNAITPILVLLPFTIAGNIMALATIDFLGFGVQPPTASLGAILRSGFDDVLNRSWLVAYSSLVLVTILLLVNFIGEGIRDALDPQVGVSKNRIRELDATHSKNVNQ